MHHKDRHIANSLGGWGYLDNVTQHIVDRLKHLFNFFELMTQAKTFDLRLQIGILTARNLIFINLGTARFKAGFKLGVDRTNIIPVIGESLQIVGVELSITLSIN